MALTRVPAGRLSAEALRGLIEEWVTRDGTDYGAHECSTAGKVEQVSAAIRAGEVVIVYDPHRAEVALLTREQWQRLSENH